MNSLNHILMGAVIYEYIRDKYGIVLDRKSFLKGNTRPDHSVAFLRPHRLRFCAGMVRKKTNRLCRRWDMSGKKASKKIGILCHYYADFFCWAHSPRFDDGLREHVRYEDELLRYLQEHYEMFRRFDYIPAVSAPENAADINRRMYFLIREQPMRRGDYATELFCAIQSCAELVLWISMIILDQAEDGGRPPMALKESA